MLIGLVYAAAHLLGILLFFYLMAFVIAWKISPKKGESIVLASGPDKGARGTVRGYRVFPMVKVRVQLEGRPEILFIEGSSLETESSSSASTP